MSYAIDVTHERVKSAMLILGIEENELLTKTLEDFAEKSINSDVRSLRYSFFNRKQQELVRQIKAHIRAEVMRSHELRSTSNVAEDLSDVLDTSTKQDDQIEKIKKRHHELLEKHLARVKDSIKDIRALEAKLKQGQRLRETVRMSVSRQKQRMHELKAKQQENIHKVMIGTDKISLSSIHNRGDLATPSKQKCLKIASCSPISTAKRETSEIEISKKIKNFEDKMEKSKELHLELIQNKKEAAAKMLERSLTSSKQSEMNKSSDYRDRLSKLVEKSMRADERRFNIMKMQTEKRIRNKEMQQERRAKTRSKLDEKQRILEKRFKEIEGKMQRAENCLEKKHEKWAKELELRNELHRLRDEEMMNNVERKKRIS
jgi:DNA repair exonuclease SbcCD ATPase subunit